MHPSCRYDGLWKLHTIHDSFRVHISSRDMPYKDETLPSFPRPGRHDKSYELGGGGKETYPILP